MDGQVGTGAGGMSMELTISAPQKQFRYGLLDPVGSVDMAREIVGAAVVRVAHREIGVLEAKRILRARRSLKLSGHCWKQVVNSHAFQEIGQRKIYLLAEVLGLDPNAEIARAYADPASYFETCKRFAITVPDLVRERLLAREKKSVRTRVAA